jgi:uncharacterized membrane protein
MESELYIDSMMRTDRLPPVVMALFGLGVAVVGVGTADGAVVEVGSLAAGLALLLAGHAWYRRREERADEVRIDERIERAAYRSGELAFRASFGLAAALFVGLGLVEGALTTRGVLAVLLLGMLAVRFGLYGWFVRRSR